MCISAGTAALLSAGLGTAGSLYASNQAQNAAEEADNQRRQIAAAGEEEAQRISGEGEQITNDFAKKVFDPSNRDASYEAGIQERGDSLAGALAAAGGGDNQAVGNVSSDYNQASAASKAAGAADGEQSARMMARLGGGSLMFGQEAMMGGELASDLAGVGSRQQRNKRYTASGMNGVKTETGLLCELYEKLGVVRVGAICEPTCC